VPSFTVNAKGLITAASTNAIPLATISVKGLASFDSTQFSVTSGAVSIYQVDGGAY
jgi:flavin-binding protein dodecin